MRLCVCALVRLSLSFAALVYRVSFLCLCFFLSFAALVYRVSFLCVCVCVCVCKLAVMGCWRVSKSSVVVWTVCGLLVQIVQFVLYKWTDSKACPCSLFFAAPSRRLVAASSPPPRPARCFDQRIIHKRTTITLL